MAQSKLKKKILSEKDQHFPVVIEFIEARKRHKKASKLKIK